MTLPATAGSSREAPPVMRRRVYMSDDGDVVRWRGELQQPNVHYLYRSFLNGLDVHNKLAVGPRSASSVCVGSLPLKLWLSFLAMLAETNAFLLYARHHKLASDQYCHADFKADLEKEVLQCPGGSCGSRRRGWGKHKEVGGEGQGGGLRGPPRDPQRNARQVQGACTGEGYKRKPHMHDVWHSH
jgi:hypothetical protein